MKIVVLGSGLVGGPMAVDLAKEKGLDVTVADRSAEALARLPDDLGIVKLPRDLSDPEAVRKLAAGADLVLSAVPGHMGYHTLQAVIEAGKNVVDIAFFPEEPFSLDELARSKGVTALVDCGVAPGMSNLLSAHGAARLDETESILILVGGLPVVREWPWEYKAVFSPCDVIEEYVRPARYVENGVLVTRPALSDPELIDFPGVGTLEVFNTDGLRTMATTLKAPNMKEKTMRYPGHIARIAMLRESGFFGQEEIEVNGARVRPLDVTSRLLFPLWKLGEGEADLTVMRVTVAGRKGGQPARLEWNLIDRYDPITRVHSMARTTGYTATAALRLLARGLFRQPGIVTPEQIGQNEAAVGFMLKELAARGVNYSESAGVAG
jgi:lysine 6-dehydrogenase